MLADPRQRLLLIVIVLLLSVLGQKVASQGPAQVYLPVVVQQPTPTPTITPTATRTATPTRTPTVMPPTATNTPPYNQAFEQQVLDRINQQRQANGLGPLTTAPELTQAARRHCQDMADHNFFSHTGSDGSSAGQRMTAAGYTWSAMGEIIGGGYSTPADVVAGWMNSDGHRAIILSPNYTEFGAGYVWKADSQWGHYWTVDFGRRR